MALILQILLILLFALHDFFVIKSYGKVWNQQYMNYWHWCKFCIVALTAYLICGISWNYVTFSLLYFVIFETVLNILRRKSLLYLGLKEWRTEIFGKHYMLMNGLMKFSAIVLVVLIEIYK